jgi:hypothetical protein
MHIFMDESGTFAPVTPGAVGLSVVGALVAPEATWALVQRKWARKRLSFPKDRAGEVKGRLLNETHVAEVVDLLIKSSCLFEAAAIDMGIETQEGLQKHREGQIAGITAHVKDTAHPNLINQLRELQQRLRLMPMPLYVQSTLMRRVVAEVLQHAPLYFVQRWPKELANFHWLIDGKHVDKVTDPEDWWKETLAPLLQTHSLRHPMPMLEGADYSWFDAKYDMDMLDHLRHLVPAGEDRGINIKAVILESFRFSAGADAGLELVDILTNATRRALKGNLGRTGWGRIPELMIRRKERHALQLCTISGSGDREIVPAYASVVRAFGYGRRSMLTESTLKRGSN